MTAERGANAREKFLDAEGLGDVVVGAGIECDHFVALGAAHREHDDGSVGGARISRQVSMPLMPGRLTSRRIEIGLLLTDEFERFFAGRGFDDNVTAERKSGA